MSIRNQANQTALQERANNLKDRGFNGIKLVIVTILITDTEKNKEANLEVHFYNNIKIVDILNDSASADSIFGISGGHRILGGRGSGQVKVTKILVGDADNILNLVVAPVGDYSTYILDINYEKMIDPLFNEIEFKFRPGCFTTNCTPDWKAGKEYPNEPQIDYLAKDFESFKHTMIVAMMERVPGWQPTSEADLDQLIIEMISASADELSDYQDRVMNESYFGTARKRVSLARHARLMDYHIYQGNQASAWIAIILNEAIIPDEEKDLEIQSGSDWSEHLILSTGKIQDYSTAVFVTKDTKEFSSLLNKLQIYTWENSLTTLLAGSTSADLQCDGDVSANKIKDMIHEGKLTHLLIQEDLDPITGKKNGADKNKRQLLQLLPGGLGAKVDSDPLTGTWFVTVRWEQRDMLKNNYCFVAEMSGGKGIVKEVSNFYGNLVQAYAGRPVFTVFTEKQEDSFTSGKNKDGNDDSVSFCDEMKKWYNGNCKVGMIEQTSLGSICKLPEWPLLYEKTTSGGEFPTKSTLSVEVKTVDPDINKKICWSSHTNQWPQTNEVTSFIHSGDTDDNYVVETDEEGESLIRFGNGINGNKLPKNVQIHCYYQVGLGREGNIGRDKLIVFDKHEIKECWNPFDVTDGQDAESASDIIRRVPESYRFRQQRAITLLDYVKITEKIPGVSRASARYMWTGSWRTVQIAIDPVGTTVLDQKLKKDIAERLDAVKLIGEDFEIRLARYVPLEVHVVLCIQENYWIDDIRFLIEQEFSNSYTSEGKMAFFHPDRWTFGQELGSSQIIGRLQAIQGVDYVVAVDMKRWNELTPGSGDWIELRPSEIIRVENNPDHMERGFIDFVIKGGRGQK